MRHCLQCLQEALAFCHPLFGRRLLIFLTDGAFVASALLPSDAHARSPSSAALSGVILFGGVADEIGKSVHAQRPGNGTQSR